MNVDTYGDTKGQTFADFRPNSKSEGARIALEIDAEKFIQDFIKLCYKSLSKRELFRYVEYKHTSSI